MLEIFKSKKQKKEFASMYQNPFQSDKIQKIEFTIEKSIFGNTKYKSLIRFHTGATTGYHRMEANTFPEIVEQTEAFIRSL